VCNMDDYYYWHSKSNKGKTLEDELLNADGVAEIKIATAFISRKGIAILKRIKEHYKLKKEDIILFVSKEFSMDNPHIILLELSNICIIKIVCDIKLHAKVYLLKGKENKVVLGSSNLTAGGFEYNLELNCIKYGNDIHYIELFFDNCERKSLIVDDKIIRAYKNCVEELANINNLHKKANKIFSTIFYPEDSFQEDTYNLKNYYFQFEDYETFFLRNWERTDDMIDDGRKKVQKKMLAIHKKIYSDIMVMGIQCHKRSANITSAIVPSEWNRGKVVWLGIRYGKTSREIDIINAGAKKDDDNIYGFQKNGCLQYSIGGGGFEINLFLAVRNDAVDRAYLHENLQGLESEIISCMDKIKGKNMEWVIENESGEELIFEVDEKDVKDFCKWFEENDKEGRLSYLRKSYWPDDKILKNINTIGIEIVANIKLLLPLYNTLVWRPK